MITGMSS